MGERLRILEMVEAGQISVEEGVQRLETLAGGQSTTPRARPALVRIVWQAVLWLGVLLLVGGGLLITAVYAWGIAAGWLACGWPLLVLGILGVLLAWQLQRARWFYLRMQGRRKRLFIAMPLPLRLAAWALRVARAFTPKLDEVGVDELLITIEEQIRGGRPFVVDVDEGQDGERVHVYFG